MGIGTYIYLPPGGIILFIEYIFNSQNRIPKKFLSFIRGGPQPPQSPAHIWNKNKICFIKYFLYYERNCKQIRDFENFQI